MMRPRAAKNREEASKLLGPRAAVQKLNERVEALTKENAELRARPSYESVESEKNVEIERLRKENEELREKTTFFSTCYSHELVGFEIDRGSIHLWNNGEKMTNDDLGRLVAAFNEKFHYGLFVQYHMANDDRGQYRLLAIYRYTNVRGIASPGDPDGRKKLPREDETAMRNFVRGFVAAVESEKKAKDG